MPAPRARARPKAEGEEGEPPRIRARRAAPRGARRRRDEAADPRGRPRGRRHGEQRLAVGHGGRAQAEGARDLRPHRRRLQEAAPPAGPERREQAAEQDALARPGAQIQEAEGRDRRRREVAVAQPEPHRRAGRAALRHQQAPDRPRGPPDAPGRELSRRRARTSSRTTRAPSSTRNGCCASPSSAPAAGRTSSPTTRTPIKDIRAGDPHARDRDRASRSRNSARSCTWCRRASARPGRPRRKWSRPTCASSSPSPRSTRTAACSSWT